MAKMDWPVAVIALAEDAELTSLPDGSLEVYWTDGPLGAEASGARQMLIHAQVLERTQAETLRFLVEWSADGRSWHSVFATAIDGLGQDGAGPAVGESFTATYTGLPRDYAPHQRYGIAVTGTPSASGIARQGRVRLSATLSLVPGVYPVSEALLASQTVSASSEVSSDPVAIGPYNLGVVLVKTTAVSASGDDPTVTLEVSGGDGSNSDVWIPLASAPITATGVLPLQNDQLVGNLLRARVSCPAGASVTLSVQVVLRA